MDMVTIKPSALSGKIKIPPSKSYSHRAIIAAFLSNEASEIKNLSLSEDIYASLSSIKALGARYSLDEKKRTLTLDKKEPCNLDTAYLDCNESGSTLRFFIPLALCFCQKAEFTGSERLLERPLDAYFDIFKTKNIKYKLTKKKLIIEGKLTSGDYTIDGSLSSQFISGLLFALPLLDGDSRIIIKNGPSSKTYIDITIDVLKKYGIKIENEDYSVFYIKGNQSYKPINYTVEGDFSQAAFFLAAGAMGSDITCTGLNESSLQGDKQILDIIRQTGAGVEKIGRNSFRAFLKSDMHGIVVDADEIPDLVPILAVFFCFLNGESRIINAKRLRLKESDRLAAITLELKKLGADITEGEDYLVINGKQILDGNEVSSHNDHRIAMALSVAATRCEGEISINGANKSVRKSYPEFFKDYKKLGGQIK